MSKHEGPNASQAGMARRRGVLSSLALCASSVVFVGGCTWDQLNPFKPPVPPPPPVESFVLRNGALLSETPPKEKTIDAELAGAREYFRREDYANAQRLYHHIADNEKNSTAAQEAMYYEAECLRLQGDLPKAADTYHKLLEKFTMNPYRDLAIQHIYDIARFWLQDTWAEVRETQEKRDGQRWLVWPRFVSFDKRKPILDREGRAIERLQDVFTYDSKGPLADKALFLCGHVHWYNQDYSDADHVFTQLQTNYPDSTYAPYAIELAIKSKLMATGGELYDGRRVAEARKLVDEALRMPQMSAERKQDLVRLIGSISAQQAEKDFQMAEFWRRTGHPGSAYFYYEIVRRRYPGTEAAAHATQRMFELRAKLAKDQADKLGPPPEPQTRPIEQLAPPQRVDRPPGMPEQAPMPNRAPAAPETAPMPNKVPAAPGSAPGPLPPGLGGN